MIGATAEARRAMPSQDQLLLDYLRHLESHQEGRGAIHLRLSKLQAFNRREHHIRAAAEAFDNLVASRDGQLFFLDNGDLLLIYALDRHGGVETAVQSVRYFFGDDPLLGEFQGGRHAFCRWYDIASQFEELVGLAQGLVDRSGPEREETRAVGTRPHSLQRRTPYGKPLTPGVLARLKAAVERTDLANMIRRQYVCSLDGNGMPAPIFSELFVSIPDLTETFVPRVNITANRWLFRHLTESLDRRVLSLIRGNDQFTISGDVSLDLNVTTLLSTDFLAFDEDMPAFRRGALLLEINIVDAFADLRTFLFARNFARQRGYRICIDGVTGETMTLLDRERLGADFLKLRWSPGLAKLPGDRCRQLGALIGRAGVSHVILCACEDRQAFEFGQSLGIRYFQGRHIENLIAEDNRRRELLRVKLRLRNRRG